MAKISSAGLRAPGPFEGLNVNFCKNPKCANFGVPETHHLPNRLLKYWFRFPKSTAETVAYPLGVSKKLLVARLSGRKFCVLGCLEVFQQPAKRTSGATPQPGDYMLTAAGKGKPQLKCLLCGEIMPMRSNQGIVEELTRVMAYRLVHRISFPCISPWPHPLKGTATFVVEPGEG